MSAISQILIVLAGTISLTVLVFAYYTVTPVFLELYDQGVAEKCNGNAECLTIHARAYDIWFVLFAIFLGGLFAAMYGRAGRKDSIEQSFGSGPDF